MATPNKTLIRLILTTMIMTVALTVSAWAQTDFILADNHSFFEKSVMDSSLLLAQADTEHVSPSGGAAAKSGKQEITQAQINEMMNNPLGELWLLFFQNDFTFKEGDALDFLGEDTNNFRLAVAFGISQE